MNFVVNGNTLYGIKNIDSDIETLVIPQEIDGKVIKELKSVPQLNFLPPQIKIKHLILPTTLINLKANFSKREIESVNLSELINLKYIGSGVFQGNKLTSVNLPPSVLYIGRAAFVGNRIESLSLPNSLEVVKDYAFAYNNITSLNLRNVAINTIEIGCFANNKIVELYLPPFLNTIEASAFAHNNLKTVVFPNFIEVIMDRAFCCNKISGKINMPVNIAVVGIDCFIGNSNNISLQFHNKKSDLICVESSFSGTLPEFNSFMTWQKAKKYI